MRIHVPSFIRIGPRNSDKQTFDLLPNDLDLDKTNNRETFVDKVPHRTLLHYRSSGITLSVSASYYIIGKIVLHYRLGNGITLSGVFSSHVSFCHRHLSVVRRRLSVRLSVHRPSVNSGTFLNGWTD